MVSNTGRNWTRTSAKNTEKSRNLKTGGAKYGAPIARVDVRDPQLGKLIDAWPTLPDAVKSGILAIVKHTDDATRGAHP
jgi:hypothetical protein